MIIFVGRRPALLGVDDERAVHASGDVLGQRTDMAVEEMQAERDSIELISHRLTRRDYARTDIRHAIHCGGVDAVEMHSVRVGRAVGEMHPETIAFRAT